MVTQQAATAADRSHIHLSPQGGPGHGGPSTPGSLRIQSLSRDDCARIHQASMELLSGTGVVVTSKKAQAIFAGHGATVDTSDNRVHLSAQLVEKALATIPSTITIPGRTPDRDYVMGGDNLGFINFGSTVWLNDLHTGKRRKALKSDVIEVTRVMDTLDSLKILISMLNATDESPVTETLHTLAASLANTTKPVEAIPPPPTSSPRWR